MKRVWHCFLCVLLSAALAGTAEAATGTAAAVWGSVQEQSAILYLQGAEDGNYTCQVGSAKAEVNSVLKLSELEVPVETVVLIDNSLSIQQTERSRIKEILNDLIANRLPGERYTIATVSNEVNYLCKGETEYTALKALVDGLAHENQYTQLTDGLYRVLEELSASDNGTLRRVLIIADGVDNKQIGYTKDELHVLIRQAGYPLYAVGCTNSSDNGTEELQELFALSRLTSGAYFYLPEVQDTMEVVSGLTAWNQSIQVTVELPSEVCDGMSRVIQLTQADTGSVYQAELSMPFTAMEPTPEPTPVPNPTYTPAASPVPEVDSSPGPNIILPVVGGVVLVAAVVVLGIVLTRRAKSRSRIEEVPEAVPQYEPLERTEFVADDEDKTVGLFWDQTSRHRLILEDLDVPGRRLEAPLQGSVTVGRDASACQLVLTEGSVARQQCRIYEQNGWIMISNLSRSNITKLDGQTLSEDRELPDGSVLQMGRVRMRVQIL